MASSDALARAWEAYGGRLRSSRGRSKANCPLHEDKNASASVDLDTGKWVCYASCGYGDVYDLIQAAEGVGFAEAKRIAADSFGDQSGERATADAGDIGNPLLTTSSKKTGSKTSKKRGAPWK